MCEPERVVWFSGRDGRCFYEVSRSVSPGGEVSVYLIRGDGTGVGAWYGPALLDLSQLHEVPGVPHLRQDVVLHDVFQALCQWLRETPLYEAGDDALWSARCPKTAQPLGAMRTGPRQRYDAEREALTVEGLACTELLELAAHTRWHANPPTDRIRAMYNVRPVGPIIELHRYGATREILALSTAAILEAAAAIQEARATARTGQHIGTAAGRRRDVAAAAAC